MPEGTFQSNVVNEVGAQCRQQFATVTLTLQHLSRRKCKNDKERSRNKIKR